MVGEKERKRDAAKGAGNAPNGLLTVGPVFLTVGFSLT